MLSPNGNKATIYSFTGGSDGANPYYGLLIMDAQGYLYGTAADGGTYGMGTVYKLFPEIQD